MVNFSVPGKWILAGEHSVLRGHAALVFPLKSRSFELNYEHSYNSSELTLSTDGVHGAEFEVLFWGVLEKACDLLKISRNRDLKGLLNIKNNIPLGAGLGASASLSVALGRWLHYLGHLQNEDIFEFARKIENIFHGESSGVDIAVALGERAIEFKRMESPIPIQLFWTPIWYLSYTGQRGATIECVQQVKTFISQNPERGLELDLQMAKSVALSKEALLESSPEKGLPLLTLAIQNAAQCFEEWGLTEGIPQKHMSELLNKGALAVKPTGSGRGGYMLSLWKEYPPKDLLDRMISVS